MRTRILGPSEWGKLEEKQIPILPYVLPRNMAVCVVEDGEEIAGTLSVVQATHFEGLWIRPESRGNAGVMRALIRQAAAIPRGRGESWVFGGAAEGTMQKFNERLGGFRLPLDFYALWVGEQPCRQES
jgi:hypothetical protein